MAQSEDTNDSDNECEVCSISATKLTLTKEEKHGLDVMVLAATDGFTIVLCYVCKPTRS